MSDIRNAPPVGGELFFDNQPELLRPQTAAALLGLSRQTIYDWHHKHERRNIPKSLFLKINRLLYLRTEVLKAWIASQN